MKRILYIGNKLSGHGNTITVMETLGLWLQREGYDVFYASSKRNKPLRLLDMLVQTIYNSTKTDYVLIDTYSTSNFWYAFAVSQLCRILNLKYMPILHGGNLPDRLNRNPGLSRMIFKHAYRNIAPSGYLLEAFKGKGFAELVYIPNTLELQAYAFRTRNEIAPKLLWVRSLADIYNPEMALEVLSLIKKEFPEAQLCMVGPDKEGKLPGLKELAKKLAIEVTFTGKLPKTEWVALAADYDIFINTTHADNVPVSIMEAMALGLPVVSTNVGGIPFLLEDHRTALLVPDDDTKAMANAIKKLLEDKTLTRVLTQNALELAQTFDFEKVKYQWFEILK